MKSKKPINTSLEYFTKVTLKAEDVIALAIEKFGAKKVIHIILGQCLWNTLEKCNFPSSIFATKSDEEKADTAAALYYLKKNWERSSKEGMRLLEELAVEARKKGHE